jgi:hypothetical protein
MMLGGFNTSKYLACDRQKTALFTMGGAERGDERIIGKEERHHWLRVENCAKDGMAVKSFRWIFTT